MHAADLWQEAGARTGECERARRRGGGRGGGDGGGDGGGQRVRGQEGSVD